jgi:hypothetical protein
MTRRDVLPGHVLGWVSERSDLDPRKRVTVPSCTCQWTGRAIQKPPTGGGMSAAVVAHHAHIIDVISRDALATVTRARTEWRDWQPGDGTCYRVRVITMVGGPDYSDRILLINVNRHTWSFQFPTVPYRMREMGPPDYRRSVYQGAAGDLWPAVEPLLVAEGIIDAQEA